MIDGYVVVRNAGSSIYFLAYGLLCVTYDVVNVRGEGVSKGVGSGVYDAFSNYLGG